jgi:hypothetical protein
MRHIEESFANFKKKVLDPLQLPENHTQIIEMRRAFYAGAADMFMAINKITEAEEDSACKELDSIRGEIADWMIALMSGRA